MANTATALRAPVAFAPEPRREAPSALPARAGWYADPERRAASRFFDGAEWTEHTRGHAPASSLVAMTVRAGIEARSYGRFENRQAGAAVLLGAISLVLNPFFITSAIAVVLGMRGFSRSRQSLSHLGRERSLAAIALAAVGMATASVMVVTAAALLTPGFLRAQHASEVQAVQNAVAQHVADRGESLASLTCPSPQPGGTILCQALTDRHERLMLNVVLPSDGSAVQVTDQAPPISIAPHHRHH